MPCTPISRISPNVIFCGRAGIDVISLQSASTLCQGPNFLPPRRTSMRAIVLSLFGALLSCGLCLGQTLHVSPDLYRKLTCLQIAQEGQRISRQGFALVGLPAGNGGIESSRSSSATVIVGPTPSHLTGEKLAELAQAAGQMNALEQASINSQCSIDFQRPPNG